MSRISQREARRLRKRVDELERVIREQHFSWSKDWPGGVHIGTATGEATNVARIKVARQLGHAVVATENGDRIEFRALQLPEKP